MNFISKKIANFFLGGGGAYKRITNYKTQVLMVKVRGRSIKIKSHFIYCRINFFYRLNKKQNFQMINFKSMKFMI
jgi:hypothetical protein